MKMDKKILLATLAISVVMTGSVLSVRLMKRVKLMTRRELVAKTESVKQNMISFNEKIRFEKLDEQPVSSQLAQKKIAKVQKQQKANAMLLRKDPRLKPVFEKFHDLIAAIAKVTGKKVTVQSNTDNNKLRVTDPVTNTTLPAKEALPGQLLSMIKMSPAQLEAFKNISNRVRSFFYSAEALEKRAKRGTTTNTPWVKEIRRGIHYQQLFPIIESENRMWRHLLKICAAISRDTWGPAYIKKFTKMLEAELKGQAKIVGKAKKRVAKMERKVGMADIKTDFAAGEYSSYIKNRQQLYKKLVEVNLAGTYTGVLRLLQGKISKKNLKKHQKAFAKGIKPVYRTVLGIKRHTMFNTWKKPLKKKTFPGWIEGADAKFFAMLITAYKTYVNALNYFIQVSRVDKTQLTQPQQNMLAATDDEAIKPILIGQGVYPGEAAPVEEPEVAEEEAEVEEEPAEEEAEEVEAEEEEKAEGLAEEETEAAGATPEEAEEAVGAEMADQGQAMGEVAAKEPQVGTVAEGEPQMDEPVEAPAEEPEEEEEEGDIPPAPPLEEESTEDDEDIPPAPPMEEEEEEGEGPPPPPEGLEEAMGAAAPAPAAAPAKTLAEQLAEQKTKLKKAAPKKPAAPAPSGQGGLMAEIRAFQKGGLKKVGPPVKKPKPKAKARGMMGELAEAMRKRRAAMQQLEEEEVEAEAETDPSIAW